MESLKEDDAAAGGVGAIEPFRALTRGGKVEEGIKEVEGFRRTNVAKGGEDDWEEAAALGEATCQVAVVFAGGEAEVEGGGAMFGCWGAVLADEGARDGGV